MKTTSSMIFTKRLSHSKEKSTSRIWPNSYYGSRIKEKMTITIVQAVRKRKMMKMRAAQIMMTVTKASEINLILI